MSFVVVIPARYASTRLPGKVLLDIGGKPMLQHVYEQASKSNAEQVYVATDDERIEIVAKKFTSNVFLTSASHESGTDRIQEVVTRLKLDVDAVVVNVQGDEPLIPPAAINQVAANLVDNSQAGISSLWQKIDSTAELHDRNAVKVVTDENGLALYFSRSPIPWISPEEVEHQLVDTQTDAEFKRHIGIYAYRVSVLNAFVGWPRSGLEKLEKLEQLRALSFGIKIHMQKAVEAVPAGVDTQKDLDAVREIVASRE